jgi:lipoate---protein ligase
MLIIKSPSSDPAFNIASEEYILESFPKDVFLLYINDPSIIVGRYQNTNAQLNSDYINERGIRVVRRLTGGGAVFHDQGNLNFSFIFKREKDEDHGFIRFTEPIIHYLHTLGINAELQGRNDLVIDGKKFSGNARLSTPAKILQHGTLLYSARMTDLTSALKSDPLKFKDKAVKSIHSRVTNILDHLQQPLAIQDFENGLIEFITARYPEASLYKYNEADRDKIQKLADEKYSTWEWNFGSSPQYDFEKVLRTGGGTLEIRLLVKQGVIKKLVLNGDFFTRQPPDLLVAAFANCRHEPAALKEVLQQINVEDYLINITEEEFLCALL